jgi:archaellum component FlaC
MSSYLIQKINEIQDDISDLKDLQAQLYNQINPLVSDTDLQSVIISKSTMSDANLDALLGEIDDLSDKIGLLQKELETAYNNLRDGL